MVPKRAKVKSPRETCENRQTCGRTGHIQTAKGWQRCPCLELELSQGKLRELYTEQPNHKTPLREKTESDLLIQGPLQTVRKHVAGALMALKGRYLVMEAYRLIEIFLEKDEELETSRPATEADLLVLLLGFGDPRNRYLPELVLQVLARRGLLRRSTWVICNFSFEQIATKYTPELAAVLADFEKVKAE